MTAFERLTLPAIEQKLCAFATINMLKNLFFLLLLLQNFTVSWIVLRTGYLDLKLFESAMMLYGYVFDFPHLVEYMDQVHPNCCTSLALSISINRSASNNDMKLELPSLRSLFGQLRVNRRER